MTNLFNQLIRIAYASHVPKKELDGMIRRNVFIQIDGQIKTSLFNFVTDEKIGESIAADIENLEIGQSMYVPLSDHTAKITRVEPIPLVL